MSQQGPAFSLRDVPASIYIGLAISFLGSLVVTVALALASGEHMGERYEAIARWRVLEHGCSVARILLFSLGLFELTKRHFGAARILTKVAAWLLFANLAWSLVPPLITIIEPRDIESYERIYTWTGRATGLCILAATVLLTIGADAWRRVPLAAAGVIVVAITSSWVPVIGKLVQQVLNDIVLQHLYMLVREGIGSTALVFIVAALAAGGRAAAPDPRAASGGFRLAHGAFLARLIAAITLALLALGLRVPAIAKLVMFGGPLVMLGTMIVFAIGIHAVAGARIDGMPRVRLYLGCALVLWWTALQFDQVLMLISSLNRDRDITPVLQMFAIAGPIVATLGVALVGSAITSFAAHHNNQPLEHAATSRTIAFLALSLCSVGIQSLLYKADSVGTVLMMSLLLAGAGIVALVMFTGLLKQAADQIEIAPGLPAARVVNT